ncbi:MAG: hypothetical protein AB1714_10410 [Acidobacteriota bacterium]
MKERSNHPRVLILMAVAAALLGTAAIAGAVTGTAQINSVSTSLQGAWGWGPPYDWARAVSVNVTLTQDSQSTNKLAEARVWGQVRQAGSPIAAVYPQGQACYTAQTAMGGWCSSPGPSGFAIDWSMPGAYGMLGCTTSSSATYTFQPFWGLAPGNYSIVIYVVYGWSNDCGYAASQWYCATSNEIAFTVPSDPPGIETLAASNVSGTGARLNGRVNPRYYLTQYRFQYGTTPGGPYTNQTAWTALPLGAPSPTGCASNSTSGGWIYNQVNADIGGLIGGSTYYYIVEAQSSQGLVQGAEQSFTTANVPGCQTYDASGISSTSAVMQGDVNARGIAGGAQWCFQYGTASGVYTNQTSGGTVTGSSWIGVSVTQGGLLPNTQYFYRTMANSVNGPGYGEERSFITLKSDPPTPPTVATGLPSNVTATGATLTGTCNPNAATAIAWFEWGLTTAYGNTTPAQSAGNGTSPVYISSNLTGLANGTTFHARIVGQNSGGTSYGNDVSFTTGAENPPTVLTGTSSNIGQTSATVAGQINPNNSAGYWFVEHGPTTSYGLTAFGGNFAAGSSNLNVSTTLNSLTPGTLYHYRFAATNGLSAAPKQPPKDGAYGTTYGGDATFTTLSAPANAPSVTTGGSNVLSYTSASIEGIVNANNFATNWRFEYGTNPLSLTLSTSDAYAGSGGADLPVSRTLTGLTSGMVWYYRLSASNLNGTSVGATNSFVLGTPSAPTVTTLDATSVGYTGAVLNAIVDMMGDTGSYLFRYGQVPGGPYPLSSTSGAAAGATDQWVSRAISGLTQGTTYYVVAQATNGGGTTTGNEVQFTTQVQSNPLAPIANTLDPSEIGQTSAKLNGSYNPNNGTNPVVWFEYGTSGADLDRATTLQPVGTGSSELPYSRSVGGLLADTQYCVRFACRTDTGGTAYGAILSFKTSSSPVNPTYVTEWKYECAWKEIFGSKFIGGSGHRGMSRQSVATGTFTGTALTVISMKDKTLGRMKITVTGATARTVAQAADARGLIQQLPMRPGSDSGSSKTTIVDLHTSGATQYQAKFTISGLSPGQHKITLQSAAGKGKNKKVAIFVDEAEVAQ